MGAKVESACASLERGVQAVLIASGNRPNVIVDTLMEAKQVDFTPHPF